MEIALVIEIDDEDAERTIIRNKIVTVLPLVQCDEAKRIAKDLGLGFFGLDKNGKACLPRSIEEYNGFAADGDDTPFMGSWRQLYQPIQMMSGELEFGYPSCDRVLKAVASKTGRSPSGDESDGDAEDG